jgi:small subunit ribosomal protein S2
MFEKLAAPRGAPDDLSKLTGVGPQLEKKLNDYGVFHYWQIAALSETEAGTVEAELKAGGKVAGWVVQARELAGA